MRRKLLESGELKERVITVPELKKAASVCPKPSLGCLFFLVFQLKYVCLGLTRYH